MQVSFFFFSPLPPRRSDPRSVPEPRRNGGAGRGNARTRPGSCSRIVRRLAQRLPLTAHHTSQTALYGVLSADFTTEQESFAKHFLLLKGVVWLKTLWIWSAVQYIQGFYPHRSPLLLIQISSEVRGVWFPVIGLMICICSAAV